MALRYFKTAATVWNNANSWSATSSSGSDNAGVPTSSDDVIFDAGSGSCNVDVAANCLTINFTGYPSAKTITMSNNITIAAGGTFTLGTTAVTVSTPAAQSIVSANTVTLTSGVGGSWGGNITFTGNVNKTLTSNFAILGTTTTGIGGAPILNGAYNYSTAGLSTVNQGILGTATIVLTGGTWTGSASTPVSNSISFAGNVTVSGTVGWNPTVANGTATLKYVSGTITTTSSTLSTTLTSTSGITIFDTAGITWNNVSLTSSGVTNSYATFNSNLVATGTITLTSSGGSPTFIFEGSAAINSPSATLSLASSGITFTLNTPASVGPLSKAAGTTFTISSGSILTINGNFPVGSAAINGTGTIKLAGNGSWTITTTGGQVRCSIDFVGDYTISGSVYWIPTVANGAATIKYTSGTITTTGSTLNTSLYTTTNIVNFDTNAMVWNNITFIGVTGTAVPNLVSDLRVGGILTTAQASGNTFAPTGSGAIRMVGSGNYLATAGSTHTLNTDWYFENWSFNPVIFNGYKIYITNSITPNGNVVLGSTTGGTTEIVMQNGTVTGSGANAFQSNLTFTINPLTGNTVTFSVPGGFREGPNVARTLKFDTNGGGTFNAAGSIAFGNTTSTLVIDLSGTGTINLGSSTIANSGNGITINVTTGGGTFNAGTSTLNISSGATTLDTQGILWANITTAGYTYTLNSTLTSTGTFQMNAVSTFTNAVLYWDPQGTLSLGTGAVGFTFTLPKNLTVQNLILNSASGGSAMLLNTNTINVTGNLTMAGSATGNGSTQINLTGTGTWSNSGVSTIAWLRNPVTINTTGTITLGSIVVIYNTTTYTAGTIDSVTNSNTLYVYDTTLVGFGSTATSYLNNLTVVGTTTGTPLTINNSQAYFLGTVTSSGTTSFVVGSSTTFGFSTHTLSFTANATHTFKALTEYIVRNQLTLIGTAGASTIIMRSSIASAANRFYLTLSPTASQSVRYINAQYIDSSLGQTIRNRYGTLTSTVNWLITNLTKAKTWVDQQE
jgi:hypothetical protein